MPVKINLNHITDQITLEECHEQLMESQFDPDDQESFISIAPILKRLNNNRTFLADRICAEMEAHCRAQEFRNMYTPQVIILKPAEKGVPYFMRANIWLPGSAQLLRTSGEKSFFYHVPHDHNFNFLTSGYLGPGYGSDYYEYEYEKVAGFPGEAVELKFIERSRLSQGQVMLYRAYRDVHNQLPAERLSVSLNIMPASSFTHLRPQYIFDQSCRRIKALTTNSDRSMEPLMHLAAEIGSPRCREMLRAVATASCVEQNRFRAIKAMASVQNSADDRVRVIEQYGLRSQPRMVRKMSEELVSSICP